MLANLMAADEPELVEGLMLLSYPSILPVSRRSCLPHIFLKYVLERCLFTVQVTRLARLRRFKQQRC